MIRFANGETADILFGNPTSVAGSADWLLDTRGLLLARRRPRQ